jgi:sugar lactone lactonase YvrE
MRTFIILIYALLWAPGVLCQDTHIYVSDAGNFESPPWQILKYDGDGGNPEVFITEKLAWPQDIVFLEADNTVLVSNLNSRRIERYDADTGSWIDTFASVLAGPTRMKIGKDGLLYVLQWTGTPKVRRYQLDGTIVDNFTSNGLSQSIGLDWDGDGNLYVSSFGGKLARIYDANGIDQGNFVSDNLAGPTNIWFDTNGDLLVSDWSGGAVRRFSPQGVYLGDFIRGLSQPEGQDYLPNGNLLIGNGGTGAVKMYTKDGTFIKDLIASGSGGLMQPNAVVVRTVSDFQINAGLNDAWYNPVTNGQGFLVVVWEEIQVMFVAWFTYDLERPPGDVEAMLGDPGHRWLTAQGPYSGDTATLDIYATRGGVFDSAEPPVDPPVKDGTLQLKFTSCNEGLVSYNIPSVSRSGEIPIERIVTDNQALCEVLGGQD